MLPGSIYVTKNMRKAVDLSKENASQIALEFLKYHKGTDKIEVALIEKRDEYWIVSGTTPIQFGEMQWPERFSVVIDPKGKIVDLDLRLL